MSNRRPDDPSELPFPLSDVSNGEWCPRPPNPKQRAVKLLLLEEADRRAKRLNMTRRQFLRTAAGTATAFMVMNTVYGLPSSGGAAVLPVSAEQCDDPEAGGTLFQADYFIMDVQIHHVDLVQFGNIPFLGCLRFLPPEVTCTDTGLQLLSQANMIQEIFVDSETAVGVISGVPDGFPLPVATMAQTRDLVNQLAGSQRALSQAMIDPVNPPGSETAIDSLEHQVRDLGASGIKTYTGNGNWWLDDETVSYPMLAEAERLGVDIVSVHKGFPNLLGPGAEEYVRAIDIPKVARDWPNMRFVVYHSGYFPGQGLAGIDEFVTVLAGMPKRERRNVYAEIGSAFAVAFSQGPEQAAHLLGLLLKNAGKKRILWGTDSIWWGSPQWQIDALKALQIPESMQEQFGYPALTDSIKARIFGKNAAKLYGIKPRERRCQIDADALSQIRTEQRQAGVGRSHIVYGPRTAEQYARLRAHNGGVVAAA